MDYYFVLCEVQTKGFTSISIAQAHVLHEVSEFESLIEQFGILRFTKGVMWIMKEVFGDGSAPDLVEGCEPDEKEGRYILDQVMMGGYFGHHDERLVNSSSGKWSAIRKILKHNLHLLAHYPSDVVWAPIWIVYHKLWKLMNR